MRTYCESRMKATYDTKARKRAVNLTLNEDLVARAKGVTNNLSGVVETLLADFVLRAQNEQAAKTEAIEATIEMWNDFNAKHGSIADDYSTL